MITGARHDPRGPKKAYLHISTSVLYYFAANDPPHGKPRGIRNDDNTLKHLSTRGAMIIDEEDYILAAAYLQGLPNDGNGLNHCRKDGRGLNHYPNGF
jgi:hypothetical protein